MPGNSAEVATAIEDDPLTTRILPLSSSTRNIEASKGVASPKRVLVKWMLTAVHVDILMVVKLLRVVIDGVSIQTSSVVEGASDVGVEVYPGSILAYRSATLLKPMNHRTRNFNVYIHRSWALGGGKNRCCMMNIPEFLRRKRYEVSDQMLF